jgi:hypothetical protein
MRLGYKHMSKCGGVFLNNIIRGAVEYHRLIPEETGVTPKRKRDTFVIASTRNPCDYYVSLWAYQHRKKFAPSQNDKYGFFNFGDHTHQNATKFREWLDWVQGPHFSVMSVRFWETLVVQKDGLSCWADAMGECTKNKDDEVVHRDLANFDPFDAVDCWMYRETLMPDLRRCLAEYSRVSGQPVNWNALKSFGDLEHNPSEHMSCDHYYTPEAADSVMKADKYMFEAFGYSTCCGGPTHPIRRKGPS